MEAQPFRSAEVPNDGTTLESFPKPDRVGRHVLAELGVRKGMTQIPVDYAPERAEARMTARRREFVEVAVEDIADPDSRAQAAQVAGDLYDQNIAAYLRTIR